MKNSKCFQTIATPSEESSILRSEKRLMKGPCLSQKNTSKSGQGTISEPGQTGLSIRISKAKTEGNKQNKTLMKKKLSKLPKASAVP